jgi:hypothetical protein
MAATSKRPELTQEEILRAVAYLELVDHGGGSEDPAAAMEEFHRDGEALARLTGESGCSPTTSRSCRTSTKAAAPTTS